MSTGSFNAFEGSGQVVMAFATLVTWRCPPLIPTRVKRQTKTATSETAKGRRRGFGVRADESVRLKSKELSKGTPFTIMIMRQSGGKVVDNDVNEVHRMRYFEHGKRSLQEPDFFKL